MLLMSVEAMPDCDSELTPIDFPKYTSDHTKALSCSPVQTDATTVSRKLTIGKYYKPSAPASFQLLPGLLGPDRSPDLSSPIWNLGPWPEAHLHSLLAGRCLSP
jgi:hypothetical protein